MSGNPRAWLAYCGAFGAIVLFPLAGAVLAGRGAAQFFRFPPPLEIPSAYPRWSWWWCAGVVLPYLALVLFWGTRRRSRDIRAPGRLPPPAAAYPIWGWAALAWTGGWWLLAWTRFGWFEPLQRFTFFPLWLGFIVAVSAQTWRRDGSCLMAREPGRFAALFATSAAFWWVFEWLNRFVRNWHYLGVADFGPIAYAANASLCFSTVLPAVTVVRAWLGTLERGPSALAVGPRVRWLSSRRPAGSLSLTAAGALLLTGAFPEQFYPALWVAPLALGVAASIHGGRAGFWSELGAGDWRGAASWSLAALICGGFWEMWNLPSAARWSYTIPYADRWHVFEMPFLGYLGYPAFGLECAIVAGLVLGDGRAGRTNRR